MILGLLFGFLACTWAFSGMLSMDPFPVKITGEDPRIPEALGGEPFAFEAFSAKSPREALAQVASSLSAKELEFISVGGKVVLSRDAQDPAHTRRHPDKRSARRRRSIAPRSSNWLQRPASPPA